MEWFISAVTPKTLRVGAMVGVKAGAMRKCCHISYGWKLLVWRRRFPRLFRANAHLQAGTYKSAGHCFFAGWDRGRISAVGRHHGFRQEGFGVFDRSVHNGERWSTARGYSEPVRARRNLSVLTDCLVQRILMHEGAAVGVEYRTRNGTVVSAIAEREVILAAGAVGSPHLLTLSGIGPQQHLRRWVSRSFQT